MSRQGGEWIFGIHAALETLKAAPQSVRELLIEHERQNPDLGAAARLARAAQTRVRYVARKELDRLSSKSAHQGIAARVDMSPRRLDDLLAGLAGNKDAVLLALDEIQDPHNLGALARSALNLGASALISCERRSSPVGDAAMRASAGALGKLARVEVPNLSRALETCREKGFWIYGADMEGQPLWDVSLNFPLVLVVGSEGRGLRPSVKSLCDGVISVPNSAAGVESLNVSCAGAVCLYEIRRRLGAGRRA